jgi:predicted transcriptional regulator
MKKSKLEIYEDILQILADRALTLDAIAFEGNMDCRLLHQRMKFLLQNELIEEKAEEKKTVYSLTNRGSAILKTLTLTKRLEKLQSTIVNVDREFAEVKALQESAWKTKRKQ